jgi:hypothetical protein
VLLRLAAVVLAITSVFFLLSGCGSPAPKITPPSAAPTFYAGGIVLPYGAGYLNGYAIDPQTDMLVNSSSSPGYGVGTYPVGLVADNNEQFLFAALNNSVEGGGTTSTLVVGFQLDTKGDLTAMSSPLTIPDMIPAAIAIDPQSRFIYVLGDATSGLSVLTVVGLDSTSGATTFASSLTFPQISQTNSLPVGLSADPSGNFLYATFETGGIEQVAIHANGTATDIGNTMLPGGAFAEAVFANASTVYVGGQPGGVYAFSPTSGGTLSPVSGSPFGTIPGKVLAFSQAGGFLYVGTQSAGNSPNLNPATVFGFQVQSDGSLQPVAGSPFQPAINSQCLALQGSTLYVGDSSKIEVFSIDSSTGELTFIFSQSTGGSNLGCIVVP